MIESNLRVYRAVGSVYFFFAFLSLFLPSSGLSRDIGPDDYPAMLVEAGRSLRLADERYWNILVHYKKSGSGRKSLVDDPIFFLSASGKTDPQAELDATIRGFFRESELG